MRYIFITWQLFWLGLFQCLTRFFSRIGAMYFRQAFLAEQTRIWSCFWSFWRNSLTFESFRFSTQSSVLFKNWKVEMKQQESGLSQDQFFFRRLLVKEIRELNEIFYSKNFEKLCADSRCFNRHRIPIHMKTGLVPST